MQVTGDKGGDCAPLDRSLVTLMAQGSLIETIGVKRTLEIANIRRPIIMLIRRWTDAGKKINNVRKGACVEIKRKKFFAPYMTR